MKASRLVITLSLVFTITTGTAQNVKSYKTWVQLTDDTRFKGTLVSADATQLIVMGEDLNPITIDPKTIEKLQVRRKGSIGRGIWIGGLSGAVAGAVFGAAGGDDEPGLFSMTAEEKAVGGAIFAGISGAGLGALFGSTRASYVIGGDFRIYMNTLPKLQSYAVRQNEITTRQ